MNIKTGKKMKKTINVLGIFLLLLITSCSGSDSYRGEWKGTDEDGEKYLITFEEKKFRIIDSKKKETEFDYTQNLVKTSNGIKTYGITLGDERKYFINFPIKGDTLRAVILNGKEKALYTISRNEYITQDDIYKLN